MKDVVSPVPPDEVRSVIRSCLENAALVNYTRICNEAKIERELCFRIRLLVNKSNAKYVPERMGVDVSPQQRVEDMIRVTELCIDLLRENEEHHGEVRLFYGSN